MLVDRIGLGEIRGTRTWPGKSGSGLSGREVMEILNLVYGPAIFTTLRHCV